LKEQSERAKAEAESERVKAEAETVSSKAIAEETASPSASTEKVEVKASEGVEAEKSAEKSAEKVAKSDLVRIADALKTLTSQSALSDLKDRLDAIKYDRKELKEVCGLLSNEIGYRGA
jgi:Holliday junction resolvase-like predicted endonuclease